ncbi:MAG TPA: replicative DNA helicase [Leptolyngbyaceae cyanobacterium]
MVQNLNFEPVSDRLPPQNIEAEEAILGGILLDPEAISRVMEIMVPEAFYIGAHKDIYRAALDLHAKGRPTDLMSITAWLKDNEKLEKVGGQSRLAQLIDRTISAANIDQYAALVMDKYTRRRLIQTGGDIIQLGYEAGTLLEQVLDQAEQKLFGITQDRPQSGLTATSDILIDTFAEIEQRSLGIVLPGIPCNFYDLDAMTQGFQRSDLIIAAGRPAMGKCLSEDAEILLSDGSLATIGELYRQRTARLLTLGQDWRFQLTEPSAYVDDGFKPVFRVTTRLGRTIETTLSHPFLTIQGWKPLAELAVGTRVAVPRCLSVFGTQRLPEHQVKLLAYFIGDGCLTRLSPQFTNSNPRLQQDFTEAALQFSGVKVRTETSQGQRTPSLYVTADAELVKTQRQAFSIALKSLLQEHPISDRQLARQLNVSPPLICQWKDGSCVPNSPTFEKLLKVLGVPADTLAPQGLASIRWTSQNAVTLWLQTHQLWGRSAHEKCVPEAIFKLVRSQLALFLNRLFATDGWVSVLSSGQVQVGFATVNEKLARQVQHLLLRFGIIACLKKRAIKYQDSRRPAWQLDITDASSITTFIQEIGIFGKEDAIAKAEAALANRQYQTNRDLIPVEVWATLTAAKAAESWKSVATRAGLKGTSNIHVGKRAPTRERLSALATALEQTELQQIATSDVYWDEIVAIEPKGVQQVYDLTIPETHNFVANDICVHNTSFVLNIARNIAAINKLPVAIFSLEMSKLQLVYRLLSSEVEIESSRLRSGRIAQQEWEKLGHAISILSQMPVFIDDTPNISVTEMRSKARRLQAEQGGALGLILIDYLQLMEGGSDNRVQELSKITRSLKGLARELNVPIIALSQLSRGVESRTNKRPMMSDLRECVTGDTLVVLANGQRVPIQELVGQTPEVVSFNSQGKLVLAQSDLVWKVGLKPIYEIRLASGRSIKTTHNHRLYSFDGWQEVKDLVPGSRLATARYLPEPEAAKEWPDLRVALLGQLIGDGSYLKGQPMRYCTASEENSNLVRNAAEQEFGSEVKRYKGRGQWYQLLISGNGNRWQPAGVNQWLRELGIFGQRSVEKRVPSQVFQLSNRQISLLLRHLWATDGCIFVSQGRGGHRVFFSTVSQGLAHDVAALLLRLGVQSTVRWSASQCFLVDVQGCEQQLKFLDQVGAFGPRIKPAFDLRQALKNVVANPNRDTLPREVFDVVKAEMKTQAISHRQMAQLRGTAYGGSAHFKFAPSRTVISQYADILSSATLKEFIETDIFWDEVREIEFLGEQEVYDLTVPETASWLADGIVSHNSGSIEQDADLIMMLYREEYYEPDTPDRGIAEVIIAKHRNGPVGTVKLLFEPQFTRFRNLANPG